MESERGGDLTEKCKITNRKTEKGWVGGVMRRKELKRQNRL